MVRYKGKKITGKLSVGSNNKLDSKEGKAGSLNRAFPETCVKASGWCTEHCYAKNCMLAYWNHEYKKELEMPKELPELVRLHSAGDFDSVRYIAWVKELVRDNPNTTFWTYTKSWRDPKLKIKLDELRQLDNMQLFASIDHSISTDEIVQRNIADWRKAWIIIDDRIDPGEDRIICPHDAGLVDDCSECGLCYEDTNSDIIFEVK